MALAVVFGALGDPVRLEIVERLVSQRRQRISQVTRGLGLSRQGARRQLQVLADAQVVSLSPEGRDVWVDLNFESLESAKAFIAKLEIEWDRRLEALKFSIENGNDEPSPNT